MSIRCPFMFGIVVQSLLTGSAAWGDISATMAVEQASLFIYEPFTIRLDVTSDAPPEIPVFPDVPDLKMMTMRRMTPEPVQRKHGFRIELIAEREGVLTIPPLVVRARGETVSTPALQLQIRRPRIAKQMSLHVTVNPTLLCVGQPADLTVTWSSEISFERCRQLLMDIPLLADERLQVFPLEPPGEVKSIGLPVNGGRVVAEAVTLRGQQQSQVLRYKLVPQEPCVVRSPPALMRCALLEHGLSAGEAPSYFYNHFFEAAEDDEVFEEVYLSTSIPEIRVRDVARAGRTSRYTGIVGPCTLLTSLVPRQLTVGQPALFTVELKDLDFAGHIPKLPSVVFAALHREFQISQDPIREESSDNSHSYTYVVRPLRAKVTQLPAVVIQTFNPDTEAFETQRSKPISITVGIGEEDQPYAIVRRNESAPPLPLHGVRHNRLGEPPMTAIQHMLEFLGQYWWGFLMLPSLSWFLLRPPLGAGNAADATQSTHVHWLRGGGSVERFGATRSLHGGATWLIGLAFVSMR